MEYLIGLVLALAAGVFAALVGLDRDRGFYPTVMIVIALIYVLFAVMGGSSHALAIESVIGAGFIFAATLGFKKNLWIVVGALAGSRHLRFLSRLPGLKSGRSVVVGDVLPDLRRRGCRMFSLASEKFESCRVIYCLIFEARQPELKRMGRRFSIKVRRKDFAKKTAARFVPRGLFYL